MLNSRSIDTVDASRFGPLFRRPRYEDYCFWRIPWTIEQLLTGEAQPRALPDDTLPGAASDPVEQVILLFVDGFGWRHFERYADRYPLCRRFLDDGAVTKLTSMFPSTTTSHVTGVHTGLAPIESGLYEWFQYHEAYEAVIAPLLFSYAGERGRDGLLEVGADPAELIRAQTVHERLAEAGVGSAYVTPGMFTPSPYNDQVCRGAQGHPYRDVTEGLAVLKALAEAPFTAPRYLHFYYGDVDATSHHYGLFSAEMESAADTILTSLEQWLGAFKPPGGGRTLVLLTADHGMTETFAERTIYLNEAWPALEAAFLRNARGAIVPAGSPRDFFLHVRDDAVAEVAAGLAGLLDGAAEVYLTAELTSAGFFGPGEPSPAFANRVGNVVVLPHEGESVWWYEKGRFKNVHRADHGGLTPGEMDIPFLAYRI